MTWEQPPLQAPGSMDCEFFAASYIARALGYTSNWEDVRQWKQETRRTPSNYAFSVFGVVPAWSVWSIPGQEVSNDEIMDRWKQAHAHGTPDFKEWVQSYTKLGHIGYASYHAGSREYNHAVALLEADANGVILADSVHGLLRLPWKPFMNPHDNFRESALVWAWYKLPSK